jgi:argininosuccinate lyase
MLATDLADYLTRCGVPFREGHGIVAALVDEALDQRCKLRDLDPDVYRRFSEYLDEQTIDGLQFGDSADKRDVPGGTSRRSILEQIEQARALIQ